MWKKLWSRFEYVPFRKPPVVRLDPWLPRRSTNDCLRIFKVMRIVRSTLSECEDARNRGSSPARPARTLLVVLP